MQVLDPILYGTDPDVTPNFYISYSKALSIPLRVLDPIYCGPDPDPVSMQVSDPILYEPDPDTRPNITFLYFFNSTSYSLEGLGSGVMRTESGSCLHAGFGSGYDTKHNFYILLQQYFLFP